MRTVFARSFCAGLAGFLASTAVRGQQLQTHEDQWTQAPQGMEKVKENKVALPTGTMLAIPLIDRVSSDKSQAGDRFEGTLDAPIVVGGTVVADKGSSVVGRVVRSRKAGRMTAPSEVVLELVELVCPTDRVAIEIDPIERSGESSSRTGDAVAIRSTAALGTALGAIFGGGKERRLAPPPAARLGPAEHLAQRENRRP